MADNAARRWWALIAIAASVLVVGLDLTVLNLALPTIATGLHASTSDQQWILDAYSLVLAAAMLPAGLLGDRFGRKKVLLVALVLFGISSAVCAYAASVGELIAARAVLGIGAAAIFPLSLAVIPVLFAPEERQRAIALMASATFISFPIGPIVGGYLLDHFWWGSVFLINVPVVVLALVAVAVLLPESRSEQRPRIDVLGVAPVQRGAGRADLRLHPGRAGRVDRRAGAGHHYCRGRVAGWVRGLGALADPAGRSRRVRPAADRAAAVPLGRLHLGHDAGHAGLVRDVRHLLCDAAVLPGGAGRERHGQRAAAAADDRRDGRSAHAVPGAAPKPPREGWPRPARPRTARSGRRWPARSRWSPSASRSWP